MNAPLRASGAWDKVEKITSIFLLIVLASVISTRLGFYVVWPLPPVDLVLSVLALLLVLGSFWFARHHRGWRLWIIAFASATQLVPMVIREPALLFPLVAGLIPVAIILGCLIALSRKGANTRPPQRS